MLTALTEQQLYQSSQADTLTALPTPSDAMQILHQRASISLKHFLMSRRRAHALVMDHGTEAWRDWVIEQVKLQANFLPTPPDVVLVHDFTQPNSGYYLTLPAGYGPMFRSAISELVRSIREELPPLFDGHAYQQKAIQLEESLKFQQEDLLRPVFALALKLGVGLEQGDNLFVLRVKHEEEELSRHDVMQLDEAVRPPLLQRLEQVEQALNDALTQFPSLQHAHLKMNKSLNQEVASQLLDPMLARLLVEFDGDVTVAQYLQELKTYVLARLPDFWTLDESATAVSSSTVVGSDKSWLTVFDVQVMCTHSPDSGAPVIIEPELTLARYLGSVVGASAGSGEGVVSTLSVRPGVLHQATGGFLLVNVAALVQEAGLWHLFKAMLRSGRLSGSDWRAMQPASLWGGGFDLPDWVGQIQVMLFGEAEWFYALEDADPDVGSLFRYLIEFESVVSRTAQMESALVSLLCQRVKSDLLLTLEASALAVLCECSARAGEDATRMALAMDWLEGILLRAQDLAISYGHASVTDKCVYEALEAERYEAGRLETEYRHAIAQGWVHIDTQGQKIGCINGLTVYAVGRVAFGQPVKITAQAAPGNDGLVDIEKEVDLAGPIHSKGMLILQGYLRGRFMRARPMALNASVVMEQTYDGVEGDSASAAETLVLLSAIAQIPLRQDIAVTGAINQFGDIQAVGGINEKIEGFYQLCAQRGLTGQQGVIIPAINRHSLMLPLALRHACAQGQFHIWTAEHLDDMLSQLTGQPADTVNALVQSALDKMNLVEQETDNS